MADTRARPEELGEGLSEEQQVEKYGEGESAPQPPEEAVNASPSISQAAVTVGDEHEDEAPEDPLPPPVVATWNAHVLTPHAIAQLKERTAQHKVDIWLVQEWRCLSFGFNKEAEALVAPPGWQTISDRATAVIVTNSRWRIIDEHHSDFSSLAIVQSPTGVTWSFLSIYLPADVTRRNRLLTCQHTFRRLVHLDKLTTRCVVGGDFNIHSGPDSIGHGWTTICRILAPLEDVFTTLHPFSTTGTFLVERMGTFKRLDYLFAPLQVIDFVKEVLTLSPGGASDHHIVVLCPVSEDDDDEQESFASFRSWRPDPQVLRQEAERERLWASSAALTLDPRWEDWLKEIGRIRGHLFNRSLAQPFKAIPSRKEVSLLRDHLDAFVITSASDSEEYVALSNLYQMARVAAFPEERQDILRVQRELPTWPTAETRVASERPSLAADDVVTFYKALYSEKRAADSGIPAAAAKLLVRRRKWPDPEALKAPFTAEEVRNVVAKVKRGTSPGNAGVPVTAYACAPEEFFAFAAGVASSLLHYAVGTRPTILGTLVFKAKPGNSKDVVAHYRPISVLDLDRRIFHGLLAARMSPQLALIVPSTQTGFIPGRSISSNVAAIALVAEACALGWLDSPVVVLEQDQEKAYDRVEHRWRDHVMQDLGTPPEVVQYLHNLYDGATIRFQLDQLSDPVEVKRGFLQGAPDSSLWYTLTYQPMLDAYEASKTGIALRFGDHVVRLSYLAYADNSFFFLKSAEDAKAYWAARRRYDLASGAKLNEKESCVTVLWPPGTEGDSIEWIQEFCQHFRVREASTSFKCLGRLLRMTAEPAEDLIVGQVSSRLRTGWGQAGRFLCLFGRAQMVNERLLSQIWAMLETIPLPQPVRELYTQVRRRLQPLFRTKNGHKVTWKMVCKPKALGGLGLLDPEFMIPATFASWLFQSLANHEGEGVAALIRLGFEKWLLQTHCMTPAFVMYLSSHGHPHIAIRVCTRTRNKFARSFERNGATPLQSPGEGLFSRMLDACLRFPIAFQADFDWSTLSPAEAAALPWWHPSFEVRDIWRTTSGKAKYVLTEPRTTGKRIVNDRLPTLYKNAAHHGLQTFADAFWLHPPSSSPYIATPRNFVRHVGPPEKASDMLNHRDRFPLAQDEPNVAVDSFWTQLPRIWATYLEALPTALVSKLRDFVRLVVSDTAAPVSRRQPFPLDADPFPWRAVTIGGVPSADVRARQLRLHATASGEVVVPTYAQTPEVRGMPRVRAHRPDQLSDSEPSSDSDEDESAPSHTTTRPASAYAALDWKAIWPRFLEWELPGNAKDAWWLVLHGKAAVIYTMVQHPLTKFWTPRSSLCPFCAVKHTCQHAYLECPKVRDVWQACWELLRLLMTSCPDWSDLGATDVLQGFPSVEAALPIHLVGRFRVWFALTLAQLSRVYESQQRRTQAIPAARLLRKLSEVPAMLMQDLLSLAIGDARGPGRFAHEDFERLWQQENTLFVFSSDSVAPSETALLLYSRNSQRCEGPSTQTAEDPAGSSEWVDAPPESDIQDDDTVLSVRGAFLANLRVPDVQEWRTRGLLQCRCCLVVRKQEVNTLLCVQCWLCHFPDVAPTLPYNDRWFRSGKMVCKCGEVEHERQPTRRELKRARQLARANATQSSSPAAVPAAPRPVRRLPVRPSNKGKARALSPDHAQPASDSDLDRPAPRRDKGKARALVVQSPGEGDAFVPDEMSVSDSGSSAFPSDVSMAALLDDEPGPSRRQVQTTITSFFRRA
ncbi:uncharacterized protein PAN0_008c3416 [Moesziomyces antarcticus]|nr:uncharacterized protein PAN0_008c3416 [Moesziomyces antarcticus]GAK65199.1 hypothetical protein PAN0_008c3416 [Moesziomyces antarcticus]